MEGNASGSFQRSTRMPLEAVVRLHFEGTVAYQNGFAANVSATGMFVKHPDPPPVGTRLVFECTIGSKRRPVQGAGTVVWIREQYEGPGRPAGIGIQFTQLDQQSREHLTEALFEFLEASLAGSWQVEPEESDLASPEPLSGAPDRLTLEEPELLPSISLAEAAEISEEGLLGDAGEKSPIGSPDSASKGWELAAPPQPLASSPTLATPIAGAPPLVAPEADWLPSQGARATTGSSPSVRSESQPFKELGASADTSEDPTAFLSSAVASPKESPSQLRPEDGTPSSRNQNRGPTPISPSQTGLEVLSRFPVAESLKVPEGTGRLAAVARREVEQSRRSRVLGLLVTLILLAAGAAGWWWWQWRSSTPAQPPLPPVPPQPTAAPAPTLPVVATGDRTLAETVGSQPAAEVAPAVPIPREVAEIVAEPEQASDQLASRTAARGPQPTPAASIAEPAELPRARALTEVESSEALGVTTLIFTFDGDLYPGSYSHSEIGGDQPRWLLRLRQMGEPFRKQRAEVGSAAVKAVRFGWHSKPEGFEQHVVVDLATRSVRLEGFEVLGSRMVVRFAAR